MGEPIDYTIVMQGGQITVTVNGRSASQTYAPVVYNTGDRYYFKAGNYFQYAGEPVVLGVNKFVELSLGDR